MHAITHKITTATRNKSAFVHTIEGMVAQRVSAIQVRRATGAIVEVLEVNSPYGAVVVGVPDDDSYVLTPLDGQGNPVTRPDGRVASECVR
jgi:hypothetical protein